MSSTVAILVLMFSSTAQMQVGWRLGPPPYTLRGCFIFPKFPRCFIIISGGGNTSGSITHDVTRPELIPNRSKGIDGRMREKYQETNISKTNDGQTTVSNGGNVVNDNNDQANVNTVNNMNTNIDSSNNNVNVLDVILVGSLSPRLGLRPIG